MLSQLEEEIGYVGRKSFWAIPIENCNSRAGVNDRIPKVYFGRREVKNGGNTESDETQRLKV